MSLKMQFYSLLAEKTAGEITASHQDWTNFLTTAARLYKYPFNEQIMIYAQRPDATACAEYNFWNEIMGRYVKRNSKGIALIDTKPSEPKIKYVFDISDTDTTNHSRPVWLWQLSLKNVDKVSEMLVKNFDVSDDVTLHKQIEQAANKLAAEYWNDNRRDVIDIVADSFLEEYDEYNIEVAFRNATAVSTAYAIMSRCNLSPDDYFEHEDFLSIFDFNTPQAANFLGTAVSQISGQILRQIEITIRNFEKEQYRPKQAVERNEQHDRVNLHENGRLSDSEHSNQRNATKENIRQIRQYEERIPQKSQTDTMEQSDSDGEVVSTPLRNRRNSEQTTRTDDDGTYESEQRDGGNESRRPDEMGGTYEQSEITSGGSNTSRADLQLSEQSSQLSLFPSEDSQIAYIEQAEDFNPFAFSMSIPDEDIEYILRLDGNTDNARMMIVNEFSKGKSTEELAQFIQKTFHGGNGIVTDNGRYCVWYGDDGIRIATGDSSRFLTSAKVVSWNEAAERIEQLLETGRYATNVEIQEAQGFERKQLSEKLWYLRQDFSDEATELGFMSSMNEFHNGGFVKETEGLAEALANPQKRDTLIKEYKDFLIAHEENRDLLRFHFHKLDEILTGLNELSIPRREFESDMAEIPEFKRFITEDEITESLSRGSNVEGGKGRIYAFFKESHTTKEQADFLKEEYGWGGSSHAVSRASHSWIGADGKGIKLEKGDCPEIQMNWANVAKRISELVRKDRFLTEKEKQQFAKLQEKYTSVGGLPSPKARFNFPTPEEVKRNSFVKDYNETKEHHHEGILLYQVGDFFEMYGEDAKTAAEILDISITQKYIPDIGRVDMCGIPSHNLEQCLEKLRDKEDVTISAIDPDTHERKIYPMTSVKTLPEIKRQITQEDIDDALRLWNNNIESKHAVVRYMSEHSRERDTASWLANEYGADPSNPLRITVLETDLEETMPWAKVQRRISQLIQENTFYTEQEQAEMLSQPETEEPEQISVVIEPLSADAPDAPIENFRITDDNLGEGGAKLKFRRNMDAINLLKKLELEGRQATCDEQEILSKYVGWGGLSDAFDESKENWTNEYQELFNALSEEEYANARASTLNAHYTSPTVIRAIYQAVENMGFQNGNILEPSMGVGNFFGLIPESMASSKLYGVELDGITGRIAKQLYPKADITVAGFETTDRKDFYDLAVGNVPFGQYQVNDRAYNKLGFSIHDYFFAKSLDQVRPGGVIAFVTSRYTMDKQSPEVRKYIAQRAELLGAIRLPNNAFKANAGTEVVSDIIFLQKRDRPIDIEPEWVHLGTNDDGFAINSYFIENPEMILGRPSSQSTQYGKQDFTVEPYEDIELSTQLNFAIENIKGTYTRAELPELGDNEDIIESIPADPNVKNYSFTVVDGEVYYRQNSIMLKPDLNATAKERVKGLVELRDCVKTLIAQQMDGYVSDETIAQTQLQLNELYDTYTAKYGLINSRANSLAFSDDSSYYLLCSLEVLDEENNLKRKADMFTKRTIKAHEVVTSVDTASEALALSIAEKACVDMKYMSELTGKNEEDLLNELGGVIFKNPKFSHNSNAQKYLTADEYLSGNVREKLREAISANDLSEDDYSKNIEALKAAQPKDLDASEIEVRLGATWIDPQYIREFMWETFETPFYLRRSIEVSYSSFTAEWNISNKNSVGYSNINAFMTYGTDRANAYRILEETLNLRDIRIYDTVTDADGKEKRVLNNKETTLAQQKQQAIKDAFRDWIWKDPDRRHALVNQYNELFNSTRPREYDGSHITFSGMNPEISLREHQLNAVAHVLYGGNTLLAHEVGAGKTFEMVAAAMESKRLGLCHKSLFVVPNHLTEQWASEFLRLYPSANILVATKKDFETRNRKKFCGRIATGDYDAVIIGHSQFERIPVSQERQQQLLYDQINEIEEGIRELKENNGERFTIKSLERTKRGLETRLKKLQDSDRKDDVVTFEQLGVDRLYVDEAHNYKNLFLYTKMRNVAGLSTTDAQKSSDMLLKCRYIDEITDNKGIVFATGTPVSNSMTELYTMMRYLQHDTIRKKGLAHFDCWASTFGETQTAIELVPEGTGYRARTRFAKFFNLPELMSLFKEAADIKTSDQLGLPTPTPIYHNEVSEPTEIQKTMVQELSERAAKVHAGYVDPWEDNMLKITSDGRKLGLDQRVINPNLPDDPNSKVNMCVNNIAKIYKDTNDKKLTQLVFCDLSTPKTNGVQKVAKATSGILDMPEVHALENMIDKENADNGSYFTIYDDIRNKLVGQGIPREEIAFIHEANTEVRKKELFSKVRSGQVRVLMGSTFKMGAGMNVQDRLIALHDLDCPWRPGDLEQRSGRIIRQGNMNPEVHIYRYVTESTFDAYLWQTVENKQKFISQIMTSKSPVRSCEDVDETALSYAEIKALCAGDERIKEKMDLDVDVARLKLMKANHQSQQYRLEDNLLKTFPEKIKQTEGFISGFESDIKTLSEHPHPKDGFAGMEVKGDFLTDKDNAGAAILESFKDAKGMEPVSIGNYRGFEMFLTVEDFGKDFILTLKGKMTHRVTLGKDARGNLTRIDNVLNAMPDRMKVAKENLENLQNQMETAKAEIGKPFPQEEELRLKSVRLAELNAELNIDDKTPLERIAEEPEVAKSTRPSVLAKLKEASIQIPPQKNKQTEKEEVL